MAERPRSTLSTSRENPENVTWHFLIAVVGESSCPTLIFHAKEAAHNRSPQNSVRAY
jgi:hypothetical protein